MVKYRSRILIVIVGLSVILFFVISRTFFATEASAPRAVDAKEDPFFGPFAAQWLEQREAILRQQRPPIRRRKASEAVQTGKGNVIAHAKILSSASSYTAVEDAYYKRLEGVHVRCSPMVHIGRYGDGGWQVCLAPAFRPRRNCLAYTFGVGDFWGFDETLAKEFGCVVRAFDPSLAKASHVHYPGPVHFYKEGLAGGDRETIIGWKLSTFRSLLDRFGENRKVLAIVKIDIDYTEWEAFEAMIASGVLHRIRQLLFEVHINDLNDEPTTKEQYLFYHRILDNIEALGFRRFYRHENPMGTSFVEAARGTSRDLDLLRSVELGRTCCHEVGYVNMRFADNLTGLKVY